MDKKDKTPERSDHIIHLGEVSNVIEEMELILNRYTIDEQELILKFIVERIISKKKKQEMADLVDANPMVGHFKKLIGGGKEDGED